MTESEDKRNARRGIRRQRGRRFATGLNVCVSVLLAAALLAMVNYLASRHYVRWDVSCRDYFKLSDRTRGLIAGLEADVNLIAFFRKNHPLHDDVFNLLKEYRYEARKHDPVRLRVRIVDPDRDLVKAREFKQKYNLTEADTVLAECGGRTKHVEAGEIADYEIHLTETGAVKKRTGFRGEQVFSSAIQSVSRSHRPIVYFLSGHGERSLDDFGKHAGFSTLGRIMVRDNIETRTLQLSKQTGIPGDCSALVVAGPERSVSAAEMEMLADYLGKNGRVLMLLDPATETGLEPLLREWGVELDRDIVVGLTLTGRELLVTKYADHPITRNFRNVTTMFYMPRSIEPIVGTETSAAATDDRPRVTVLASNTADGWAEKDLDESPPRFDEDVDRRGPVSVAVAIEKGAISGIELEIKPTRLVVFGDSYFVSNGAMRTGVGANGDLFMSALNWLIEREALLAIGPKVPGEIHLGMSRRQIRLAYLIISGGLPAAIAVIGALVWLRRRL